MSDVFSRYLANNPPPRRVTPPRPKPPRPAAGGYTAPRPPDTAAFLESLFASAPPDRTEAEWDAILNPRVQPYIDAATRSRDMMRGRNEALLEQQQATQQGLADAFFKTLTGGLTGAEAEAFAKANFGGSHLPAQIAWLASNRIAELTNDYDDRDWEITGQYLEKMDQIPGLREQLRADIENQEAGDYDRRFKEATLLIDEANRYFANQRAVFESDREFGEKKREFESQMALAAGELGIKDVNAQTSARNAQTSAKNAEIRAAQLKLDKAKEQRQKAKTAADIRQADANIRLRREELKLAQQKAKGGGSDAQKAERDLAIEILKDSGRFRGKTSASGVSSGGLGYQEAYDYIYGRAELLMGSYRSKAYINSWVRARLKSLGYKAPSGRPRQGD